MVSSFATIGLAASTRAAVITWSSSTTISADTDVSTIGTLDRAYTFGLDDDNAPFNPIPGTGKTTTVNGVTFVPFSGQSSDTQTFYTTSGTDSSGNPIAVGGGAYNGFGSTSAPFANLSGSYQNLLTGGIYTNVAATATITLNGLHPGYHYEVETWVNDSRSLAAGRSETVSGSPSATLSYNSTSGDGGVGQFAIGSFIADSSSQTLTYVSGQSAQVNGLELRVTATPEPGSLALLGLGGVGLLKRRRIS